MGLCLLNLHHGRTTWESGNFSSMDSKSGREELLTQAYKFGQMHEQGHIHASIYTQQHARECAFTHTRTNTHTGGPLRLPELPSVEPAVQVGLNEK